MTNYCVGCDNIVGGESGLIHKVAQTLEKAGNQCEELSVGPNFVQSKGLSNGSKGKVAVFIVGGSDIGTYVDFKMGLERGYYHYKFIWFAFASWTATTDKWITENGLKKTGLVRAHDDNFSKQSDIAPYLGKSADNFFQKNKTIMNYVYGETPEELAKKILGGGSSSDEKDSGTSTATSIKESLKKAVSGWDGEVEIRLIDDTVYVNKIPDPTKSKLIVNEFENVQYDSVTVTDINPQTTNKLTLHYEDYDLTLSDETLIKRFGEVPLEIEPDDTVKDYDTAVAFLQKSWNKIRRDDGRQVELKINGDMAFKVGQWVRAFLPSFYIDDYMYITRMSNDEDGSNNWSTGLTLVDYPPSFGAPQAEPEEEEEEEEEDELTDELDDTATEEATT